MKRLGFAVGAVVLFAGAGGTVWKLRDRPIGPAAPSPTVAAPPAVGVGALGRLEPGWKVFQIAPAPSPEGARVESLLVEEGDEVAPKAVIAVLDTHSRREAALKEARAQVVVVRAKLALVVSGTKADEVAAQAATVEQLLASSRMSEAEFRRVESLRRSSAVSAEEFDQRQFQMQIARATFRQAEAMLAAIKTVRPEDVAVARAELAKAEAGVALAEADLEIANVRSPIAGRVLKIHARPGEKVGEDGVAAVGDTSAMHAVAEVYEGDIPRVRVGQRATVFLPSLSAELAGEVVHVGWEVGRRDVLDNDPVKDTDARVVEVRVKLDDASSARAARLSYARVEVRIDATGGP